MTVGITPDPGLVGPTGPTGAAGATGPTGAQGLSNSANWQHQETANTDGGTATSGSYEKRPLNTELYNNISGASISSSVVTLPAGTYILDGYAAFYATGRSRLRWQNTSDSTTTLVSVNIDVAGITGEVATISGIFTIAAQKNFELQSRVQTTVSGNGFGDAAFGFSTTECYASITVTKIG